MRRIIQKAISRVWHQSSRQFGWRPLVDINEFSRAVDAAIDTLGREALERGAYFEFGVSRGTSMLAVSNALGRKNLTIPLIGFDSFRGMPPGSEAEGWQTSQYASTKRATRKYLKSNGVNLNHVHLVEGWFEETLTHDTIESLPSARASIVMIDCDTYSASKLALNFAYALITERAVVIFDDWESSVRCNRIGQMEAFEGFLATNRNCAAQHILDYKYDGQEAGKVFVVEKQRL